MEDGIFGVRGPTVLKYVVRDKRSDVVNVLTQHLHMVARTVQALLTKPDCALCVNVVCIILYLKPMFVLFHKAANSY